MSKVKTDELDQWHDYGVYTPARLVELSGDIDQDTAMEFIKNIRLLDHTSNSDIVVLINTPGGDVHQGMAIFDAIKECNSNVLTHAVGPCWSMGSVILQAGDTRKISSNATIMVHTGSSEYDEDHSLNIKRWIKENERIGKRADDILLAKIRKKKPRFTKDKFEKLLEFDTIYTADQALDMGLADEIAEHKEL